MVRDSQKRARNKWDSEHCALLACKVRREYADRVRACCEARGDTVNAVLRAALDQYLEQHEDPQNPKI